MKKHFKLKLIAILTLLVLTISALASCGATGDGVALAPNKGEISDNSASTGGSTITSGNKNDMAEGSESTSEEGYTPKIIKTVTIEAETDSFNTAVSTIEEKVNTLGGYMEKSEIRENSRYYEDDEYISVRQATYTLRIPADKLSEFLAEAGSLLEITAQSSDAKDVGNEYYDMQARISVLETERAVLEKMLSEATSVSQMLELESKLYDVIYEIESYKTALKVYDSKVSYSTVHLTVNEQYEAPKEKEETFGARLKRTVKESCEGFVDFCQELVIGSVVLAPVLLGAAILVAPLAVIILIIVLVIKRKIKKHKANKEG